jgi:hypothetical protein
VVGEFAFDDLDLVAVLGGDRLQGRAIWVLVRRRP